MFLGGWTAPISLSLFGIQSPGWLTDSMWFWNWFWLFAKTFALATVFLWVRATFPRFRYDQIMRLGWKIFIPVTLVWLVSILTVIMFLGGWLAPIDAPVLNLFPVWIWLGLKTFVVVTMFLWVRSTFPRYRYDQIMRLGWKVFIPLTIVWLVVIAAWMQTPWNIWR